MAWGRRCDIGCETWPDQPIFAKCPECGEKTGRFRNLEPMDVDEAHSIVRHKAFEHYYERRCAQRGVTVDGPLPDDYGPLSRPGSGGVPESPVPAASGRSS